MKKLNKTRRLCSIMLLIVLSTLCLGCGKKQSISILEEPSQILITQGLDNVVLEPDSEDYKEIFAEIKKCWDKSLVEDRLEFLLLMKVDEDLSGETKVTFQYEKPVTWTMYGDGKGDAIEADTYSFFPFNEKYGRNAVISEKDNFNNRAFIVNFQSEETIKECVERIIQKTR